MTVVHHYPRSTEDAAVDELAMRCSAAERLCAFLAGVDQETGEPGPEPRGARHCCDALTEAWAHGEVARAGRLGLPPAQIIRPEYLEADL